MPGRRLAPLAALIVLAGCSTGGAGPPAAAAPTTSTSAPSSAPSTTTPATTTPVVTTPAAPTAAPTAEWPPEAVAEHGGRYWAVYLEVARSGTEEAELEAALASARSVGYAAGRGFCEEGAVEALGLDPAISYDAVSVFFDSEADAQTFVDLYQPGVVGTAFVTAYCLD